MREVSPEGIPNDTLTAIKQLQESNMVIVSLLMRLYDIQLAMLNATNSEDANRVYDAHSKGGHFNPQIFIPTVGDSE